MHATAWRWFPIWLMAAMAAVFAVNGIMVYNAMHTFPGAAGEDGFDLSNEYKRVLETARQQAVLGWRVEAGANADGLLHLRLTDRKDAPLAAVNIDAQAERPVGPVDTTVLRFRSTSGGQYQADRSLPPGQWDLMLRIQADGRFFSATHRVMVK